MRNWQKKKYFYGCNKSQRLQRAIKMFGNVEHWSNFYGVIRMKSTRKLVDR